MAAARAALAAEGFADPLPQPGPLQLTYERAALSPIEFRGDLTRALRGAVRVRNAGDRPVRLTAPGTLNVAGTALAANVAPDSLPLDTDSFRTAPWPGPKTVAPGETLEYPASFFGLPEIVDRLPYPFFLTVPYAVGGGAGPNGGGGEEEVTATDSAALDVAAYHRGLAGLTTGRDGPRDALAVLRVKGELTWLGRFAALGRLRDLAAAGARRGVLLWDNAVPVDPPAGSRARRWEPAVPPLPEAPDGFDPAGQTAFAGFGFRTAGTPAARAGFIAFFQAPAAGLDAGDAGDEDDERADEWRSVAASAALRAGGMGLGSGGPAGDFGPTRPDPPAAAAAALRSALRSLGPDAAEKLIRTASPLVKPGAVRFAGPNLSPAGVPLLVELAETGTPAVRSAAAAALGTFDSGAAREALVRVLRDGDDSLAGDAALALAASRYPGGRAALAAALGAGGEALPETVFAVLADRPDPAWADTLVRLAGDADSPARVSALTALVRSEHPAADGLLRDALAGADPDAARAAFTVLASRGGADAERLALDFALRDLRRAAGAGETPPPAVLGYLGQVRPAAAAGPLWAAFDAAEPGGRAELIRLLAALAPAPDDPGAPDPTGERIADAWDGLTGEERVAGLEVIGDLAPARLPGPAGEALRSGEVGQERTAVSALETAGTDGATVDRLLADAFAAAEDHDAADRRGGFLQNRATPAARRAILDARWSDREWMRRAADYLIARFTRYGPGRAFFRAANNRSQRDTDGDRLPDGGPEPHKASLPLLDQAVKLDPTLATGWSQRAYSRGQAGSAYSRGEGTAEDRALLEGARDDFKRALALDPYDNLAMTGLAILEIELGGDVAGGLARAEKGFEKYPDDRLYAYNLACTYGVAAKAVQRELAAGDPAPDAAGRLAAYLEKARGHLVRSARLGLDDPDHRHHAKSDPDLAALHGDPVFEQIIAGQLPDLPADGE